MICFSVNRLALILLSQSVAAFAEKNHIFEKTHFSACGGAEMGLPRSGDVASRFSAFIDGLMSVIGTRPEPNRFAHTAPV
jgi:hypothetical protein